MAKVSFTKITPIKEGQVKEIKFNDQIITVKQYLPLEDKIQMVNKVANDCINDTGINPIQRDVQMELAIVENYANINLTEKQKENIHKTYDLLMMNGVIEAVKDAIPAKELIQIEGWLWACVQAIESFGNSARGILKDITTNYDGTKLNIEELLKDIKDPAMAEFVKNLPNLV